MSDIQVTAGAGGVINVSTGTVVGPLPQLQVAAGNGITINTSGGVSTISANVAGLSIPVNLADLTNVSGSPSVGQVLAWDGSTWAPTDDQTGGSSDVANLADLGDVSGNAAAAGQALTWDGSQWSAANVPVGTTVNGLSGNVTLVAGDNINVSADGQNITIGTIGQASISNLTDLLDVNATMSPADGQALVWDGSQWTADSVTALVANGTTLDLGTGKILYSNVYATLADLPPAADYHGMFAHVHNYDGLGTGAAFYAHAGNWVRLADSADVPATFVSGINGLTGQVVLAGGSGTLISQSGNQLTISSAQTFSTINGESGSISLIGGNRIDIATVDGVITASANLSGYATESFVQLAVANANGSVSSPTTLGSVSGLAGLGLRLDDFSQLELADDPPRDVSLLGFAEDGLRAVFDRQATADADRDSATYEVEFLPVAGIPSVLVADQVGDANRTLSVQGVVAAGQRWAEIGVSSDNGSNWLTQRVTLEDDSGVWAFRQPPPGSLRSGQRLLRVRGADTASNLATASYSNNFTAQYAVAGYHAPTILQSQCSGSGVSAVGVLADEDLSRTELNLAAADVRVGWMPSGSSATYATSSAEATGWLPYFAYNKQYEENSSVFSSSLSFASEGWGSLVARADGEEGDGDTLTISDNFYNFAGNYTLPKPAQQEPTAFLVAKTATATNLPAGVTAGTFSGAIATRRSSPSSVFVLYQPDSAQEFQFADGNVSVITLSAEIAASSTGSVLLIAESDGMYPLNEGNANWSYTTEPSMSMLITDSGGATIASQAVSPVAGEATELTVSADLDAGSVYYITLTVSHTSGSRALVPQVRLRTDEGGAT